MYYINTKFNGQVETIDQFSDKNEAYAMAREYTLAYGQHCYVSKRSTKEWKEK